MAPLPSPSSGIGEKVVDDLPGHVAAVRKGLLNFHNFIGVDIVGSGSTTNILVSEVPVAAFKPVGWKASHRARDMEFVEGARELSFGARILESKSCAERGQWVDLYYKAIRSQMDEPHLSSLDKANTIVLSRIEKEIGLLPSATTVSHNFESDSFLGFQTYGSENLSSAPFGDEMLSKAFTKSTLTRLQTRGLDLMPNLSLAEDITEINLDSQNSKHQVLCFPWCMIHINSIEKMNTDKKEDGKDLSLPARAATAASATLSMFEILARYSDMKQDDQHVPPVVSIVTHGANVTVWLAYFEAVDENRRDHNIQAIWNGDITKLWDAIQFCRIIENLLFWAQYILRPKIAHNTQQWMLRHCPEAPNIHSRLENDRETAEMVYRIQDRLNALGISPTAHLPELIQQAVVFSEVMRSSSKATESATIQATGPSAGEALPRPQNVSQASPSISEVALPGRDTSKGKERKNDESDKSGSADNSKVKEGFTGNRMSSLAELPVRTKGPLSESPEVPKEEIAIKSTESPIDKGITMLPTKPILVWGVDSPIRTPFLFSYKFKTLDLGFQHSRVTAFFNKIYERHVLHPEIRSPRAKSDLGAAPSLLSLRTRTADKRGTRYWKFRDSPSDLRTRKLNKQNVTFENSARFDGPSSTLHPLTSATFELSFPVKTWWASRNERKSSLSTISLEAGLGSSRVSTLVTFFREEDGTGPSTTDDSNERVTRADRPKRPRTESLDLPREPIETPPGSPQIQPTIRQEPQSSLSSTSTSSSFTFPLARQKIPWGDKHITVRLPRKAAENKESVHILMDKDGTLNETTTPLDLTKPAPNIQPWWI